MMGIFARVANDRDQVLSISAREGAFMATTDDPDTIILRLNEGTIVQDTGSETPRVLSFSRHDLPIDLPAIEEFRARGDGTREYILPELLSVGWSNDPVPDGETDRASVQATFHYRLVEVVMMLLMPLLAVALAIPPKRSTSALGVFVSIVLVVSYHKVNQYALSIASLGRFDPVLALWTPFAVFAALILWMYYRTAHVPGGQALGALETVFSKFAKKLKKLFSRRRPASLSDEAVPGQMGPAEMAPAQ